MIGLHNIVYAMYLVMYVYHVLCIACIMYRCIVSLNMMGCASVLRASQQQLLLYKHKYCSDETRHIYQRDTQLKFY